MPPYTWWELFGGGCPHLQFIAMRVLSQSATSSSCEQNWSHFGFVHSDKRNRLTTAQASRLVWLFSNLRLAKQQQALEQPDKVIPWDECSEVESEYSDEDE
eukprot:1150762-Pelagomonas_calceolata.AAC.6